MGKPENLEFKILRYYSGKYYEGEVIKGTTIRHGRGFLISETFHEGYWKNDNYHV